MQRGTLYFSDKCPDTAPFVAALQENGIPYNKVNITDSMANLKQFLALRDSRPEFTERKARGMVGVPVIHLPNDELLFEL